MNDDPEDLELPRGLALAWGIATHPHRGPKRELSVEGIVEVAVTMADADGLSSVSMAAVARKLGFTTMSLYRYVTAKDELVLLMAEQALGLPPARITAAETWQDGLRLSYAEMVSVYSAHPWLLDVPLMTSPTTPNSLAWFDATLSVLSSTGLNVHERVATSVAVIGLARWQVTVELGYVDAAAAHGQTVDQWETLSSSWLRHLVTADSFPALHPVIQAGALVGEHGTFGFTIERYIEGIEHYLEQHGPGTPPPPPIDTASTEAHSRDPKVKQRRAERREAERRLREAIREEKEAIRRAAEKAERV